MTKKELSGSFQAQSEQIIREEALKIARATQSPGQTKEETKLIAKGIARGIAEYKKQEKVKKRERARLQKRRKSPGDSLPHEQTVAEGTLEAEPLRRDLNRLPGFVAAAVFAIVGLLHLARLVTGTAITVGTFSLPLYWSGALGAAALALAAWLVRASRGLK